LTGQKPDDLKDLKDAAEKGDMEALRSVAILYELGLGDVPADDKMASQWWQKAAEKGDGLAKLSLAKIIERGGRPDLPNNLAAKLREEAGKLGIEDPEDPATFKEVDVKAKPIDLAKPTILIVEDSATTRKALTLMLEEGGYQVLTADDGRQGLKVLSQNPRITAILSDFHMPQLNGLELLQQVRAHKAYANIPFIICTTEDAVRDVILKVKNSGGNGWITKPVKKDVLHKALEAALKRTK
jgi:CheY-like chemotaxis protein